MNKDVPTGAAILLDFIAQPESGGRYDVIYGHHERELAEPITKMTVNDILSAQIQWGRKWKSSAAGRYQIVQATLATLRLELGLSGKELFDPDLQDRLGYGLLKRRGYEAFWSGRMTRQAYAKALAQEWASLPVLAATKGAYREVLPGQSYYAGDGLNKALVSAAQFEGALTRAHASKS